MFNKTTIRDYLQRIYAHRSIQLSVYLTPSLTFLIIFTVFPLIIVLIYSFLLKDPWGRLIWEINVGNYISIFTKSTYFSTIFRSILFAAITVVISFLLGYPVAYWISLYGGRRKNLFLFLVIVPSWTSYLIRTYAWLFILGNNGLINSTLQTFNLIKAPLPLCYNEFAVIVGLIYTYLPFMILPLYSSLDRIDISVLEAASDLGANPIRRLLRVTLPLTKGGILGGGILTFMPSVGSYVVPKLLGASKVPMMGPLVARKFLIFRDWPLGSAIAAILVILTVTLVFLYIRAVGKGAIEQIV